MARNAFSPKGPGRSNVPLSDLDPLEQPSAEVDQGPHRWPTGQQEQQNGTQMPFTKFHGVPANQLDQVIKSLTDEEFDHLEAAYLNVVSHLILDYFAEPLCLTEDVDSTALFCRLYQISLAKTEGV